MFRKPLSSGDLSGDLSGDIEAGFSGGGRTTYWEITPSAPSKFFLDNLSDDESRHFLNSCFFCNHHLAKNRDIYMYRGDTPFCSVECRQEQIEIDEARERKWKIAMMEKQQKHMKSSSTTKSKRIKVRFGTVVPA